MYILDKDMFMEALRRSPFGSIQNLSKHLKIHRNTIHHYLMGAPVIPKNLARALNALNLSPADVIRIEDKRKDETLLSFLATLQNNFPDVAFILFGSRARRQNRAYSDYDIGVYSENGISHAEYLEMLAKKDELVEDLPFFVDLINFNQIDIEFLKKVSADWKFLSGNISHWIDLTRKVQNG